MGRNPANGLPTLSWTARLQELAQRRRLKQQRRDVGLLRQLQVQLQGESAEQAARLARRIARTAEKSLQFPPKLGRQKFQPLPTQVSCSYPRHAAAAWLWSNRTALWWPAWTCSTWY